MSCRTKQVVGTFKVFSHSYVACQQCCAGDRKVLHCVSPVFCLVNAEYAPSFAFASGLELDHVVFGLEADAKRLLEIAYLFGSRLLLCRALLFSLLLRLLAGSA